METGTQARRIYRQPSRIPRIILRGLLIAFAVLVAIRGYDSLASSPLPGVKTGEQAHRERPRDALGVAGGAIPGRTTIFSEEVPGIVNLDPELLGALRRAAGDAASAGVEVRIESGWRSPEYQDRLLRDAVAEYGSEAEAARWVATAETSPHVSGDAVDIAPPAAAEWLAVHGARYGLCQIYANEPWHYELRPDATVVGCPRPYPDPTHDPRMQG
jgi:hypothetical protein